VKVVALALTVAAAVGLVLLALAGVQGELPPSIPGKDALPTPQEPPFTIASIPYWDQERAVDSLQRNVDLVDEITLFWYTLAADGSIVKYEHASVDSGLISAAKSNGVKTLVLIANLPDDSDPVDDWDWRRVDRNIADADARQRHIAAIVALVEELGVDGVHIDYEQLRDHQTEALTQFITDLAAELHGRDKRLAVSVLAQEPDDDELHGQDLAALGRVVDELVFISFNQHYEASEPGPIASIEWVRDHINHAIALGVPKDVIILGIPLFGYDWPRGGGMGRGIEYEEVAQLIEQQDPDIQFDRRAASPQFRYENRIVWFENARSASRKIQLAQDLGLGGISFWRLGREDSAVWDLLRRRK
jgi:spore germination protein